MTPKHILSLAVFAFVILLGAVGIIDAAEPGHTLNALEATELSAALAGLTAGALGVVITRNLIEKRRKKDDPDSDERN